MSARAPIKAKPSPTASPRPSGAAAFLRLPDGQRLTARDLPGGIVPVAMGRVQLDLTESTSPDQPAKRRWSSLAYGGGVFAQWFSPKCIIDLDTLRLPDGPIPTRLTHQECWEPWDPDKSTRIGFADTVQRTGRGIEAGGGLLDNPLSSRVMLDGSQGYPWQVSIIAFGRWEIVPDGATEIVNGIEMSGGSCILRDADLRAVDYVELGADVNNQILQLATLAAQQGITTLTRGHAAQHGAQPMTTANLTQAAGSTTPASPGTNPAATLEAVEPADITLDWLKENRPDLIEKILEDDGEGDGGGEAVAAEGEGYDPDKDKAEMALPATVATLKALPGSTPEFIVSSLEAKLTLGAATNALNWALVERLQAAERKAELAAQGAGADAVSTGTGTGGAAGGTAKLSGTDPVADWNGSAELRAHWAKECGDEDKGRRAFLSAAGSCVNHGDSYLDMLPASIR